MLATTLIYITGLALCVLAGAAVTAALRPRERWLTVAAPALGAAAIVTVAFPLGFFLPGSIVAVLVLVLVVAGLAAGLRRRGAPLGDALRPTGWEALTLGVGALIGLALLIPVGLLGFPTTIAPDIADGWARSVLAEWIRHTPLIESGTFVPLDRPVGSYSGMPPELGAGFEYLVAIVSTLVGRRAFEVAQPVAALGAPIALAGWAALFAAITDRRPRAWQIAVLAVGIVSPVFVLPFAGDYLTQFLALALWPFALAATYVFAERPTWRAAIPAAVGLAGIAGVYPPVLPWVAPPAALLVLACATRVPEVARRVVPRAGGRVYAAVATLVVLGLAVAVLAPIHTVRAVQSVILFSGKSNSNEAFPVLEPAQDLGILLGSLTQFSLPPYDRAPTAWQLVPPIALLLAVAAIGLLAAATMLPRPRRPLLALGLGVGGITLAAYLKYKHGDGYGYGYYKALISGGALLAGLLAVALAGASERLRAAPLIAAGVCLAIWVPVAASLLQRQYDGNEGFRAGDRALARAIDKLPRDGAVLVEGAADTESSFHMRMTAGYMAAALERPIEGIGTTATYFTGGGAAGWRPDKPWKYVIARDAPSPFLENRRTLWRRAPFRLQLAPALDVTPYAVPPPGAPGGTGGHGKRFWLPSAPDATEPVDYIAGPVELVVANREDRPARARLALELMALGEDRTLRLGSGEAPERRIRLPQRRRRVTEALTVPANSTTVVKLDPGTPALAPDGQIAPLVALTRVEVAA